VRDLDEVVIKCLDSKYEHMLETMPREKVREFFQKPQLPSYNLKELIAASDSDSTNKLKTEFLNDSEFGDIRVI